MDIRRRNRHPKGAGSLALRTEEFQYWVGIPYEPEVEFIVLTGRWLEYTEKQRKAMLNSPEGRKFRSFEAFAFAMDEQEVKEYDIWRRTCP